MHQTETKLSCPPDRTQSPADLERYTALQAETAVAYQGLSEPENERHQLAVLHFYSALILKNSVLSAGCVQIQAARLRNELIDLAARALALSARYNTIPYKELENAARESFIQQSREHGDAYKYFGSSGMVIRLWDKLLRVQQLVQKEKRNKNERMKDTLRGIYNCCIMAVLLIDRGQ